MKSNKKQFPMKRNKKFMMQVEGDLATLTSLCLIWQQAQLAWSF